MQDSQPLFFRNSPLESIWSKKTPTTPTPTPPATKDDELCLKDNPPPPPPSRVPSPDTLVEQEMQRTFDQIASSIDLIEEKDYVTSVGRSAAIHGFGFSAGFSDGNNNNNNDIDTDTDLNIKYTDSQIQQQQILNQPPGLFITKATNTNNQRTIPNSGKAFQSLKQQRPPGDYLCKLCEHGGHWMKDCQYFEVRTHHQVAAAATAAAISEDGEASTATIISRTSVPPANYCCRLCAVGGHWIEHCSLFKPKYDNFSSCSPTKSSAIPPRNYLCNICHKGGHWIQQCSDFVASGGVGGGCGSSNNRK